MKIQSVALQKLCAIITTTCFIITVVCSNLVASINPNPIHEQQQIFNLKNSKQLNALFSDKYGKVVSCNNNFSDTVVINIQDLHCDYSVQKNISSLIDEISNKYKIENVFVEGGIGNIDTSFLTSIQPEYKNNILEMLLKDGKLTGTEYFSAINNKTNLLKGVEEKDIYLQNIVRLKDIIKAKDEVSIYLSKINKEIEYLSSKYLSSKNKQFSKLLKQAENKEISQKQFVSNLIACAKNNNISLKNYKNLNLYYELFDNNSINNKKIKKELVSLLNEIKNTLTYQEYNQLIDLTSNLTDTLKLQDFIESFCNEKNINLQVSYPNLSKFFIFKEQNLKCNPIELVKEERKLIDVLRTSMSENQTELEVSYLIDFEQFYKGYLTASLTSQQWEYVKLGLGKFKDLYAKYSISNDITKLEKYSSELNKFYDVNTVRNEIFISKMKLDKKISKVVNGSDGNIEKILSNAKKIVILVAGGYHTDGINEILNNRKITNITITPNVANSTKQSKIEYEYLAQQQAMSIKQMIALGLLSNATQKEQVLSIVGSLLQNQNLDGININILVEQLNQIFARNIKVSLSQDGKQLEFLFTDGTAQVIDINNVGDILWTSGVHNAICTLVPTQNGKLTIALKIKDIKMAIDLAAKNGMEEVVVALDDIILENGMRGVNISEDNLQQWQELLLKEVLEQAEDIKQYAKQKNIKLSMHSMTFIREKEELSYTPRPNNSNWKKMFQLQIEIAEKFGMDHIVFHAINDYATVEDWADLVEFAAQKGIYVNFENDLKFLEDQQNLYNNSLVNGFLDADSFVVFLNEIKKHLSVYAIKYFRVCIDTSRVFSSLSSNQNLSDDERLNNVTFDNLLAYIQKVIDAGYTIDIIHLAQFNKKQIREVNGKKVYYNKNNISDDGVITPKDLRKLLELLKEHNPNIVVLQETEDRITSLEKQQSYGDRVVVDIDSDIAKIVEDQNKSDLNSQQLVKITGDKLQKITELVLKTTFNCGQEIFTPQIYQISKDVCVFMVENKWYLGNGAIWNIATSQYAGQTLDGIEPIVYEYMPDFMQQALLEKQIGINVSEDYISKNKSSKNILTKICAFILTLAMLFNLTACNINENNSGNMLPKHASVAEINDYVQEAETIMSMFETDIGYSAYLTQYMTQEDLLEWSSRDFYYVDGLVNTFDQANAAITFLKMGDIEKAREALLYVQENNCKQYEVKRISGRKDTLYKIYKSNREGGEILGEIVWVGLAAVQYKLATGSTEFDDLIRSVDEYLISRECVEGAGYYMGSSSMYFTSGGYSSAEHQVDIMAYLTLKSMLSDEDLVNLIPEHIKINILPKSFDLESATEEQIIEMISQVRMENSQYLLNACKAFYKYMYRTTGIVRGYNDYLLVLDPNSWGIQVLNMIKIYNPTIQIEENGIVVEKSIYELSELSKIDLNDLLDVIESTFFVTDDELKENLSSEDYNKFKGYHLYTWSKEKFVNGKLNWSFEWSMQVATAYYLVGDYKQAQVILDDATRFAKEMGLPTGLLPTSNVNAVKNYSDYGWLVPNAPSFSATITSVLLKYGLMNADPYLASPFYPVTQTNDNIPSSILPTTILKLNKLISSGNFSIEQSLFDILSNETLKSLFNPLYFINKHEQTLGAKILTIVTTFVFVGIFSICLLQTLPISITIFNALSYSLLTNMVTHMIIDFRYLKSIGIEEAIALYGNDNVKLTEKGISISDKSISKQICVINDKPKNVENFNFRSIPIKIKTSTGKVVKCWIGNYNGVTVLFANGAKYETIVSEFSKTRQFESIFGKKIALRANVDVIEVDMNNPNSSLRYSRQGNPIIGANILKTDGIIDLQKEISLLNNKKIESVTINQNIAVYIDDDIETINSSQDFMNVINLYIKNESLGVDAKILFSNKYIDRLLDLLEQELGSKELAQQKFIEMIKQLKDENKEIIVIFDEVLKNTNLKQYQQYGIFSYIANNEYVDGITSTKTQTKFVTNLNQISSFDGSLSIIKVSTFRKEIEKASGIFTFLTSSLNLKEYMKNRSIKFIKQVASNFDYNQIPKIDIDVIGKILKSNNKFEELSKYLVETDSISMYYLGLANDEEKSIFVNAILERILVANYLRNFDKDDSCFGLKNKKMEEILSSALIAKYNKDGNFNISSQISLDESLTTSQLELEFEKMVIEKVTMGFKNGLAEVNDSQAIDDLIKLIPLYADRNVELRTANVQIMEIQNIKGILSAA